MDVVFASEANAVHLLICVSIEMQNFNIIRCVLVIVKKRMREFVSVCFLSERWSAQVKRGCLAVT